MGTVSDGLLQNIHESIIQRVNECRNVGELFEHLVFTNQVILLTFI